MATADGVEYVCDEGQGLTARDLLDRPLPLLVLVSAGFYSNQEEMCFSLGQVLRLHEVRQQRRALVHDDHHNTLSLPLDYSHLFHVIGASPAEAMTLEDIVQRFKLPVKIKFANPHMRFDCGPDQPSRSLAKLTIVRVHEETYFVANTVIQGELLETVLPVPMYLKDVRFRVVTRVRGRGIRDGGRGHMQTLLHGHEALRGIDFSQDRGDRAMVQLSCKAIKVADNIYQNIQTNIYINVLEREQRPGGSHGERAQLQQQRRRRRALPSPPSSEQDGSGAEACEETEYMNYGPSQTGRISEASLQNSGQQRADDGHETTKEDLDVQDYDSYDANVYEPVGPHPASMKSRHYTPLSVQPSSSATATTDVVSPHTGLPDMAEELKRELQKRRQKLDTAHASPAQPHSKDAPPQQAPRSTGFKPPKPSAPSEPDPAARGYNTLPATGAGGRPVVGTKPPLKEKPTGRSPGRSTATAGGEKEKKAKKSAPSQVQPTPTGLASGSGSGSNVRQTSQPAAPPPLPLAMHAGARAGGERRGGGPRKTGAVSAEGGVASGDAVYVNQREMAVIAPTRYAEEERGPSADRERARGAPRAEGDCSDGEGPGKSVTPVIQTTTAAADERLKPGLEPQAPLPLGEPLDHWTIQHVQQLLSRLNLSKYGAGFQEQLIDGPLLQQLTDSVLEKDFGMSGVEIIRLRKFVDTRHVPK